MSKPILRFSKKAALSCLIALNVFYPLYYVQADWVDFDSVGNTDDVLSDLGFDKTAIRYAAASFNASRFKKQQPQVSLTFTPTDPVDGQKVTATATPMYFVNDIKNLYFTWYLKSKDCKKGDTADKNKEKCDLNDDGKINIEDYKIRAARIYASNDFDYSKADYSKNNDSDGYDAVHGGDDQKGKNNYCYLHDTESGSEYKMDDDECDDPNGHLFPSAPGNRTGDGSFGASEEKFWHTNPSDNDTADTGNVDEANVAGLGAKSFTWTYSSGDELGVVVEGASAESTQVYDASYKIMWAMINNDCDIKRKNDSSMTTSMTMDDVNDCLYDNMVTPSEGTGVASKLTLSLSQAPETPINDASGNNNGDEVSFSASLSDDTDASYIHYDWEVFESDDAGTDNWGDSLIKSDLPSATTMSGIGINTLRFKMDFKKPKKYMKVSVNATETMSDGETRSGHDYLVFPMNSSSDDIKVYSTKASSDGSQVSMDKTNRICMDESSGNPKKVCPVVKDEIIGMELDNAKDYDNFAWTINGDPVSYDACFFSGCQENGQIGKMFFPVLEEEGTQYDVQLIATKDSGEKTTIDKVFQVTKPDINIMSNDTTVCRGKYLGNFNNSDGTITPVYSTTDFEAAAGYNIEFMPETVGVPALNNAFLWSVDGENQESNEDGSVSLAKKDAGEYYSVSILGHYSPDSSITKALNKYWGVSYNDVSDLDLSKTISVKFVTGFPGKDTASINGVDSKKIFATIASGIPAYFIFLIRIALSMFLIIFILKFIFSLAPQTQEND